MTASNFLACFNETESFEGGYVNDPHDPGGATLKGVTQAAYNAWRVKQGLPVQAVRGASDAEIQAIYREQYWNPVRGDDLFVGLDLVMVDYGWGSGPVTAIRHLQKVLEFSGRDIDGQFGLETLGAVNTISSHYAQINFINRLCDDRTTFFRSLATWVYFGRGWTVRLNGIRAKALAMNAAAT
jgi:lysozyme family protein